MDVVTSAMHPEPRVPEWTLTDRLRKARELTEMTPEAFAREIDVSKATVYNYENPLYTSRRKDIVLKQWALRTGVDLGWLITGVAPSDTNPTDDGPGTHDVSPTKWYGHTGSRSTVVPLLGRAA